MFLRFPDCNSEDYSFLYDLFLKRGKASFCRRFFPVIHSTWHLEGLVAAMQTEKRGLVQAGLLKNRRWMMRDLPALLKAYLELEKIDKNAANALLKTIKEGCNTNSFITAYFKAQTQEEKNLIKNCFQNTKPRLFSSSTEDALASGDPIALGKALCSEINNGCSQAMASLLIEKGAEINYHSRIYGGSPLVLATQWNCSEIAELLLNQPGIDVNPRGSYYWRNTPLINAIGWGNEPLITKLLNHPNIDINLSNNEGCTPLIEAIKNNRTNTALFLLTKPTINVNQQDHCGNTALMHAVRKGNEKIIKALLNNTLTNVNLASNYIEGFSFPVAAGAGDTPLMRAASRYGNIKIVSMLLKHPQIDVRHRNAYGSTAFGYAVASSNIANVKTFLNEASNLEIEREGRDALKRIGSWNNEIYSIIIERVNIDEALIWALKEKRLKDVKRFLPFVNVDFVCPKTGDTLLIAALRSNFIEGVELLMPLVDVNKPHPEKKDHPINYARNECMQALLLSPHSLAFSYDGNAPFFPCIHGKLEELSSWLSQNPKRVNIPAAKFGDTLLHYAAAKGHLEIVSLLLKQPGINPNLKNCKGDTPLHIAIRNGREEVIKLLTSDKKTNLNLKNKAGDTPLSLAARLKRDSMVVALLKRGVKIDPLAIALSIDAPIIFETLVREPKRRHDLIRK